MKAINLLFLIILLVPSLGWCFPVDIILQLKAPYDVNTEETLSLLAKQTIELFGTGGNQSPDKIEGYLGYVNTPVSGGYITVRVEDVYARILEQMSENEMVKVIRVEWPDKTPDGGWEPITYVSQCYDINNQPYQCLQTIGSISK